MNKSKGVETPASPEIPVLNTCVAVGGYLAISTNLRYQVRPSFHQTPPQSTPSFHAASSREAHFPSPLPY